MVALGGAGGGGYMKSSIVVTGVDACGGAEVAASGSALVAVALPTAGAPVPAAAVPVWGAVASLMETVL